SATGPPSRRTTPSSRLGCRFGSGTVSSSARISSSPAIAYDNRSYVGEAPWASRRANSAYIDAMSTLAILGVSLPARRRAAGTWRRRRRDAVVASLAGLAGEIGQCAPLVRHGAGGVEVHHRHLHHLVVPSRSQPGGLQVDHRVHASRPLGGGGLRVTE